MLESKEFTSFGRQMSQSKDLVKPKKPGYVYIYNSTMGVPFPFVFLAIFIFVVSMVYGPMNRTLGDYIRYSLLIGGVFSAFAVLGVFYEWLKSEKKMPTRKDIYTAFTFPVVLFIVAAVYYSIGVTVLDFGLWAFKFWSFQVGVILATVFFTLFIGGGLFWFRLRYRCMYGLSETLVGVAVAGLRISQPGSLGTFQDPNFYLAMLTAGVYLVVRGLDNMHQGLTKDPIDPIAAGFIRWYRAH
jgi:hypothetical protein